MKRYHAPYVGFMQVMFFLVQKATSEHVLPVFQGLWYKASEDSLIYDGVDACSVDAYTYKYLSDSPEDYLHNYFEEDEFWKNCDTDYDSIEYGGTDTDYPEGFISTNKNDWSRIIQDPNATLNAFYKITSYCDEYGEIISYLRLSPLYDCPSNSRLSYDIGTNEVGCTTTPVSCLADIVGRDLDSSGVEGIGHVGLVASINETDPYIMEVLNDDVPGIYKNLLSNFTAKTKYWGERYGAPENIRLPLSTANDIISAGLDQVQYQFSYTYTWEYYPGGTSEHPDSCEFRCDNFVYYSYDMAGVKIKDSFTALDFPTTLFDDFQCGANPPDYCSVADYQIKSSTYVAPAGKSQVIDERPHKPGTVQNRTTPALDVFSVVRPIFSSKAMQREHLPVLIAQYQASQDIEKRELFARCLCFELKHRQPSEIAMEVRTLLSDILWEYKYLLDDNLPLAIMNNHLDRFLEIPSCQWLSAYFTAFSETEEEKESGMVDYVRTLDNIIDVAHYVSSSRLSQVKAFTLDEKCKYGRFFQEAYNHNTSLSDRDRDVIRLGLAELSTHSTNEAVPVHVSCNRP